MENIRIRRIRETLFFSHIAETMRCEHRMRGHTLMLVRSGRLVVDNPQERIEATAGQYVFVRRDCTATMRKCAEGAVPFSSVALALPRTSLKDYYARHLTPQMLPRDARPLGSVGGVLEASDELRDFFRRLEAFENSPEDPDMPVLEACIEEAVRIILTLDARLYPTLFDFHETWKIDLMDFMEKHYTEDLTQGEFASYTGRSLATFKRDFAKVSLIPPMQWVIEHRLDLARRLLMEGKHRASDVYTVVGFKNRSHFSTAYKRRFGYAPSCALRVES